MALVVLLRGVNVGGHKTFRPAALAAQLAHLGAVNVGAAGTFVVRERVSRAALRDEFARRLPFEAEIAICSDRDIAALLARGHFVGEPTRPDLVRFVSTLCRPSRSMPETPMTLPSQGDWLVKILAAEPPFVVGVYRRHIKAVGHLGQLDRLVGLPVTTRNGTRSRPSPRCSTPTGRTEAPTPRAARSDDRRPLPGGGQSTRPVGPWRPVSSPQLKRVLGIRDLVLFNVVVVFSVRA